MGWPAPQFAVEEIGAATERQGQRHAKGGRVGEIVEGNFLCPCIEDHDEDDTDNAAMAGHAAFPDGEKVSGIGEGLIGLIEQAVAESPAKNHARHRDPRDVIGDRIAAQQAPAFLRLPAHADEKHLEASQVSQAVIPDAPVLPKLDQERMGMLNEIGEERHGREILLSVQ